ncbi:MAG: FecR domain-containing protein [Pyrinomonadaceae bacterium]|nr:FecR domain-containing protein [Sphingobacteriaceae bacterium]
MISKEEYLVLYKKFLDGECTSEELDALEQFKDELEFVDVSEFEDLDKNQIRKRILRHLKISRGVHVTSKYLWLKVAAILCIALTAALLISEFLSNDRSQIAKFKTQKTETILPGSDKAFLTTANGSTIVLTDAENGEIGVESGIKITKTKQGILIYSDLKQSTANKAEAINTLTIPKGGQYQLVLSDGTKVWLNSASVLRFPVSFTSSQRKVELSGEAYFEVSKNKHKPFIVHTNRTDVHVLGTHFNVNAYTDDQSVTTTLLEGSVKLVKSNSVAMLKPGQQGVILEGKSSIDVKYADLEQVMAWKNGFFVFKNTDIKTIMKQAERWYDIEVEYQTNLEDKEFGGKISRYKNIEELLKNLELTGTVHFKVQGRRVIVMK